MNKFCTSCGAALEEGKQFCGNCGKPVQGSETKATQADSANGSSGSAAGISIDGNDLAVVRTWRVIGRVALILAVLGFFMPAVPFGINTFQLATYASTVFSADDILVFNFVIYLSFFYCLAGCFVLLPLLIKKQRVDIECWDGNTSILPLILMLLFFIDLHITIKLGGGFGIIGGFFQVAQAGPYMIIIGCLISSVCYIVTVSLGKSMIIQANAQGGEGKILAKQKTWYFKDRQSPIIGRIFVTGKSVMFVELPVQFSSKTETIKFPVNNISKIEKKDGMSITLKSGDEYRFDGILFPLIRVKRFTGIIKIIEAVKSAQDIDHNKKFDEANSKAEAPESGSDAAQI